MSKLILYVFVSIVTIWAMEGFNINSLFKKGQVIKSRILYLLIILSIIYLVTNFIYDFISLKIF